MLLAPTSHHIYSALTLSIDPAPSSEACHSDLAAIKPTSTRVIGHRYTNKSFIIPTYTTTTQYKPN